MRRTLVLAPVALLMTACAEGCAIARALYVAVVHNSYAPSRAERERIAARGDTMVRELGRRRLVVLPVAVLGRTVRYDTAAAARLAERLREDHAPLASAEVRPLPIAFEPQANELAIFWTRYRRLADSVTAHPRADADYVLLVDVFGAPERGVVGPVHAMAVTGSGAMAYWGMWNSHAPLWQTIRPRSLEDAMRMVETDLGRRAAGRGAD